MCSPICRDPEQRALSWWKKNHPTWLVYKCDQKTPARLQGDEDGPYVLDISNPDVIAWQVKTYAKMAANEGYKYLATDNFALGNAVDGCGVFNAKYVDFSSFLFCFLFVYQRKVGCQIHRRVRR